MGAVGEVRHEAPGATSDGGVCERHLKGASVGMQWGGGSGRMHLGRTEKTIQRGGIRRLGRNIYARTHLEKHRHLETTTLEKRSGETSGKSLERILKGFEWAKTGCRAVLAQTVFLFLILLETLGVIGMVYLRKVPNCAWNPQICFVFFVTISF